MTQKRHRAIWLSDIHLGARGCKADFLLDFIKHNDAEYIYLLGDIIDGWRLKKSWYWPKPHNDVVQKILRQARKGTAVIYMPGNHDGFVHDFTGLWFGGIQIQEEAVHETRDGRRVWMLHGDRYDGVVRYAKWLALLGDWAYQAALVINHYFNLARRRLGYPYWSLSAYLKHKVKNAVNFISDFERLIANEAHRREVDVVVCGHIHKAEMRYIGDILYCNTGDWVESCTAMTEGHDGTLSIHHWADQPSVLCNEREINRPVDAPDAPEPVDTPVWARQSAGQ